MKKKYAYLIATGFGSGLAPKAPGTFGSLLASILCYFLQTPLYLGLICILSTILGIHATSVVTKTKHNKDPGFIVIDEIAGQSLTFLMLSLYTGSFINLTNIFLGFILFRFFDISKIWPASFFDKKHTPVSVMLDDLVAGCYAGIILIMLT